MKIVGFAIGTAPQVMRLGVETECGRSKTVVVGERRDYKLFALDIRRCNCTICSLVRGWLVHWASAAWLYFSSNTPDGEKTIRYPIKSDRISVSRCRPGYRSRRCVPFNFEGRILSWGSLGRSGILQQLQDEVPRWCCEGRCSTAVIGPSSRLSLHSDRRTTALQGRASGPRKCLGTSLIVRRQRLTSEGT